MMTLGKLGAFIREETKEKPIYAVLAGLLGTKNARTIAHNTDLRRKLDGAIMVVLHWTPVLTFYADGRVVVRMNGYNTVTTRARINLFSPRGAITFSVYTKDFCPYLITERRTPAGLEKIALYPFEDGMVVDLNTGSITFAAVAATC